MRLITITKSRSLKLCYGEVCGRMYVQMHSYITIISFNIYVRLEGLQFPSNYQKGSMYLRACSSSSNAYCTTYNDIQNWNNLARHDVVDVCTYIVTYSCIYRF